MQRTPPQSSRGRRQEREDEETVAQHAREVTVSAKAELLTSNEVAGESGASLAGHPHDGTLGASSVRPVHGNDRVQKTHIRRFAQLQGKPTGYPPEREPRKPFLSRGGGETPIARRTHAADSNERSKHGHWTARIKDPATAFDGIRSNDDAAPTTGTSSKRGNPLIV